MYLPNRHESANEYRYGFNGMEKDDEVSGEGNSYTAEYWQYDSRLGRRWNRDPVVKTHESPYVTFANNPIWFADPDGADSTLAAGSTRWQFTIEKGDTYSSISKRTGVSIENLRYFNQGNKGVANEHEFVVGTIIEISDPSCSSSSCNPISVDGGNANIVLFDRKAVAGPKDSNTKKKTSVPLNGTAIVIQYTNSSNDEYRWWQTFDTDNPINGHTGNDIDAGMRFYNTIAERGGGLWNYTKNTPVLFPTNSDNTIGHVDTPSRDKSLTDIYWEGDLFLQKKVDGKWINIMHITYGFKVDKKGNFSVTPLVINNDNN
jgi:RHS repeat-associated protein